MLFKLSASKSSPFFTCGSLDTAVESDVEAEVEVLLESCSKCLIRGEGEGSSVDLFQQTVSLIPLQTAYSNLNFFYFQLLNYHFWIAHYSLCC